MKTKSENWEYLDITLPLSQELPFWPQSYGLRLDRVKNLEKGDGCNASNLHIDLHAGTHIDAPLHHVNGGDDVTQIDIKNLCGPVWVTEISDTALIGPEELEHSGIPGTCRRLLIRTDNKRFWGKGAPSGFSPDFTALSESGAKWIAERRLLLVGIDYLSVQPYRTDHAVHSILFNAETILLEGVDLNQVELGWWELICFPLRLTGAEASPVRAVLRKRKVDTTDG